MVKEGSRYCCCKVHLLSNEAVMSEAVLSYDFFSYKGGNRRQEVCLQKTKPSGFSTSFLCDNIITKWKSNGNVVSFGNNK